jgi:hypothetical protein
MGYTPCLGAMSPFQGLGLPAKFARLLYITNSTKMMSLAEFKKLALSFPNTVDAPHFDRIAFKVEKKRIFATLHEESATVNMKLSVADQSAFCTLGKNGVYAVPNKWGLQGWTTFELKKASKALIADALDTAYKEVFNAAPKKKR